MYHFIISSLISRTQTVHFTVFTHLPDHPVEELFICPTPILLSPYRKSLACALIFFFLGKSTSLSWCDSSPPSVINVYCFIIIIYLPMMLSAQTVVLERFTHEERFYQFFCSWPFPPRDRLAPSYIGFLRCWGCLRAQLDRFHAPDS